MSETFGQFAIPGTLGARIMAWQEAWEQLYREPIPGADTPTEELRAIADRRHTASNHLLGLAYVLLSDLADGSVHQSEGVTADRMPGGKAYPYRPDHAGTETPIYDGARGPFDPAEPAGTVGDLNGPHGEPIGGMAHSPNFTGAAR